MDYCDVCDLPLPNPEYTFIVREYSTAGRLLMCTSCVKEHIMGQLIKWGSINLKLNKKPEGRQIICNMPGGSL